MTEGRESNGIGLWGRPFLVEPADSAPVRLLSEQAALLTEMTAGRVEGVVLKSFDKGTAWASLYAKVPSLQGYMYKMLTVGHPANSNPADPTSLTAHDTFRGGDDWDSLDSMARFASWLQEALSSEEAHSVVENLLQYTPIHASLR